MDLSYCVLSLQIMDKEGGERTIEALDGLQLKGSPRPLSVQPYVPVSAGLFLLHCNLVDTLLNCI